MSKNGRRKWSAAEKLRVVLAGMQPNVSISDLCRQEGINATQYYGWRNQMMSSSGKIFEGQQGRRPAKEERLEAELRRLKNVIAEITAENLELKKGLSE
jgi:transposase